VIKRLCVCLILLVFALVSSATGQSSSATGQSGSSAGGRSGGDAASAKKFLGTWTGTWDGAGGGGGIELVLESKQDGAAGGRVSVTGEPTYKATLKTLAFDGPKMSATYDFPPDDSLEIVLVGTFDGDTAKGTWSARAKGRGEVNAGGWTVKRK
jgi:hypothetical protein